MSLRSQRFSASFALKSYFNAEDAKDTQRTAELNLPF